MKTVLSMAVAASVAGLAAAIGPSGFFDIELATVPLDGQLLGLQRSAKVVHSRAAPIEDEVAVPRPGLADASLLGLQRSAKILPKWTLPQQDVARKAPFSFADVSMLGMQRSATLVRKHAAVKSEDDVPLQRSAELLPKQTVSHQGMAREAPFSFADASVLGMQRSATLVRRDAAVELDDDEPPHLSFADVSVLGMQRSAKVVRRKSVPVEKEDGGNQPLSFADISFLGMQRSAKLIHKQTTPVDDVSARPSSASQATLLGSVKLVRKQPPPVEDEHDGSSSSPNLHPSQFELPEAALQSSARLDGRTQVPVSLASVSALGFQRAVGLIRGQHVPVEDGLQEQAPL